MMVLLLIFVLFFVQTEALLYTVLLVTIGASLAFLLCGFYVSLVPLFFS